MVVGDHEPDASQASLDEPLQEPAPGLGPLAGGGLNGQNLAVALLGDADGDQERDVAHGAGPPRFEVRRVEVEVRVAPLAGELAAPPLGERLVEASCDPAHGVLRDADARELTGDRLDLARGDALEVHLQHRLLHAPAHAAVALEHFGEEGHLTRAGHADLLDESGLGEQPAGVVAVSLAPPALSPFTVLSLKLCGHLLLHDLLQDAFNGVTDAVFERGFDGSVDLVVGHHRLGWLNPQDSLRYQIVANDVFMLLATDRALESKWVPWELGVADQAKGYDRIVVVPVTRNGTYLGSEYVRVYRQLREELGSLKIFGPGGSGTGSAASNYLRGKAAIFG